jgi:hypothetical protein
MNICSRKLKKVPNFTTSSRSEKEYVSLQKKLKDDTQNVKKKKKILIKGLEIRTADFKKKAMAK